MSDKEEKVKIVIEPEVPEQFKPGLNKIKERAENISRSSERGIINEVSGASVTVRDDGQVNVVSNEYAQLKLGPDGRVTDTSIESKTITNRRTIQSDEVIINEHKLNNMLWELTDFKQVLGDNNTAVGNFCVFGTVLVKTWDLSLNRYVMVRRQVRMPMFSPVINVPEIPEALHIPDPTKQMEDMQVVMESGYQVNGPVIDKNTKIKQDITMPKQQPNTQKDKNSKTVAAVNEDAKAKAEVKQDGGQPVENK